ncbi:MAG: CPBP family intramembrane metalloprotease domain-containing protein [Roseofilum sp. Belize BBD 4]|uniref:CPBP family glutamic-type intramembrane protease n=1 Tax=Roseofilum sp. Belize BBD 4 TaxID=2821500 RepID=UPI001B18CB37|nr:CPBP family glutamic-type intramembrane protease [Roseofilum sp. Belize BBD 4]MBP0035548.1 CPBP family intramembrane metalloprotease domain-containing protein [Roseofilum sp. Belize BBD 4]
MWKGRRSPMGQRKTTHIRRWMGRALLSIITVALVALTASSQTTQRSSYSLSLEAPFNQVGFYPTVQPIAAPYYRSTGEWLGRLILPSTEELNTVIPNSSIADWAWIELYHTPLEAKAWQGKTVRLEWQDTPRIAEYVNIVTTDVNLSDRALENYNQGNVIPTRLQGRTQVGPLQSLAGARPQDDLIVRLNEVKFIPNSPNSAILQTALEPIQVTGRFYGLVKILEPLPSTCADDEPCRTQWYKVKHYNSETGEFNGPEGTVRIPQQPLDNNGRWLSTPEGIEKSPAGDRGWYIYGARDEQGQLIVQGIRPRSLFELYPDRILLGSQNGLDYIQHYNWKDTQERKGTTQSLLISPTATRPEQAVQYWNEGESAIVMHLFGGIGGENGEPISAGTVTGHFAYGIAQVVRDPFTQELQFDILYQQVYAHNPNGIISGTHTWTNYMGNLQRGWLGTRPVSDVVIKLDALTQDYNFDGEIISPIREFWIQLQVMMARYRTGDGTGVAEVTPATSCVQDSSQALYITIEQIKQQILNNPKIVTWLRAHPNDPQTQRLSQLVELGENIAKTLAPQGVVREDWKQNAQFLSGVNARNGFVTDQDLLNALLSWQTLLPRSAYDQMAKVFLDEGGQLWFLRTNQVGGWDSSIEPIAPTGILGQFPIISTLAGRILLSLGRPEWRDWSILILMLALYALIALVLAWSYSFWQWVNGESFQQSWHQVWSSFLAQGNSVPSFWKGLTLLIIPVALEEFIFRVLLVPHPTDWISKQEWWLLALVSLIIYLFYKVIRVCFGSNVPLKLVPVVLLLSGTLGSICILTYGLTGSFWVIWVLHGLIELNPLEPIYKV